MGRAPKTRNAGTMTESAFWSMIRSTLRRRSMFWKPINEYKQTRRIPNNSENKRLKWLYECEECHQLFPSKEVQVDHIEECGSLKCAEDLPGFVTRLFAEDGFKLLCLTCHKNKPKDYD